MWVLKSPTGALMYLKPCTTITIGRKNTDIIITNDDSISRSHASITVQQKKQLQEDNVTSVCILRDIGSKYGTFIMKETGTINIEKQKPLYLNHNDKIRFGLLEQIYIIIYIPIITITSSVSENDKSKLENIISTIDGIVTSDWTNSVTHLTMSQLTLTIKVSMALACCIPIVGVSYWEAVKCAVENNIDLPAPEQFVPVITEPLINAENALLYPNMKRKTLFANLIFVFLTTKQYTMYCRLIHMAGGKSLLYSKQTLPVKKLCALNVIVLNYSKIDATQSVEYVPEYDSICKVMQENKRRLVSEYEIPLAVLYCSTEKHCNPKFNFTQLLKQPTENQASSSKVIVVDTQDIAFNSRELPKVTSNVRVNINTKTGHSSNHITDYIPETINSFDSIDVSCIDTNSSVKNFKNQVSLKMNDEIITDEVPTNSSINNSSMLSQRKHRNNEKSMCSTMEMNNRFDRAGNSINYIIPETAESDAEELSHPKNEMNHIYESLDSFSSNKSVIGGNTGNTKNLLSNLQSENIDDKNTSSQMSSKNASSVCKRVFEFDVGDKGNKLDSVVIPCVPCKIKDNSNNKNDNYNIVREVNNTPKENDNSNSIKCGRVQHTTASENEDRSYIPKQNKNELNSNMRCTKTKLLNSAVNLHEQENEKNRMDVTESTQNQQAPSNPKRTCLDNLSKNTLERNICNNDEYSSEYKIKNHENSNKSLSSSFLRSNGGRKVFQKVYKTIPKQRISLKNVAYKSGIC